MSEMTLYSYWRLDHVIQGSHRAALEGLTFKTVPVDLGKGEHTASEYSELNPGQCVPSLKLGDGTILTQSMAILNWLDRAYPDPPLVPADPKFNALNEAAAFTIACDIHPVNNLRVINRLKELGHDQADIIAWMHEWMQRGFVAYQSLIEPDGRYSFGDKPSTSDICLVAQLYNAHRWDFDLSAFSRLAEIEARCLELPAFDAARPENQPDANDG